MARFDFLFAFSVFFCGFFFLFLFLGAAGSLSPAFASARPVGLTVRLPYAFALNARLPTVLREPLGASVTF